MNIKYDKIYSDFSTDGGFLEFRMNDYELRAEVYDVSPEWEYSSGTYESVDGHGGWSEPEGETLVGIDYGVEIKFLDKEEYPSQEIINEAEKYVRDVYSYWYVSNL